MKTKLITIALSVAVFTAAAQNYRLATTIKPGTEGGWDYLTVDADAARLYVSHGMNTQVINTDNGQLIGTIPDTKGVHGIAIAKI